LELQITNAVNEDALFEENIRLWHSLANEHNNYAKRLQAFQTDDTRQAQLITDLKTQVNSHFNIFNVCAGGTPRMVSTPWGATARVNSFAKGLRHTTAC